MIIAWAIGSNTVYIYGAGLVLAERVFNVLAIEPPYGFGMSSPHMMRLGCVLVITNNVIRIAAGGTRAMATCFGFRGDGLTNPAEQCMDQLWDALHQVSNDCNVCQSVWFGVSRSVSKPNLKPNA